jgi:hypothetical protein
MANVLTNAGCKYITDLLAALEVVNPDFVGWGHSASTTLVTDTALGAEGVEARSMCAKSKPANDTAAWTANIVSLSNQTITEAAIFDDQVTGVMILKADFPPVSLAVGAAIQFIFTLRIVQA